MRNTFWILALFTLIACGSGEKPYTVKIKYKSGNEYVTAETEALAANDSLAYVEGFLTVLSHMYLEQKMNESGTGFSDYSDVTLDVYSTDDPARWINYNYTEEEKKAIHRAVFERSKSIFPLNISIEELDHLATTYTK